MKAFKKELKAMKKGIEKLKVIEDTFSFADAVQGVKPMEQDKIVPNKKVALEKKKQLAGVKDLKGSKQVAASFSFSDMYQAVLPQEGPMRYCREGVPTHVLKQLRRGDYSPEVLLDLHGMTRERAKTCIPIWSAHHSKSKI